MDNRYWSFWRMKPQTLCVEHWLQYKSNIFFWKWPITQMCSKVSKSFIKNRSLFFRRREVDRRPSKGWEQCCSRGRENNARQCRHRWTNGRKLRLLPAAAAAGVKWQQDGHWRPLIADNWQGGPLCSLSLHRVELFSTYQCFCHFGSWLCELPFIYIPT